MILLFGLKGFEPFFAHVNINVIYLLRRLLNSTFFEKLYSHLNVQIKGFLGLRHVADFNSNFPQYHVTNKNLYAFAGGLG